VRDTLEDLENFVIDVVINNRRGVRANLLRLVFRGLSGIYSAAVRTRLYFTGIATFTITISACRSSAWAI
jgi:hypothetical protein